MLRYFSKIARINRKLLRARKRMEKHLDAYSIAQAQVNALTMEKKQLMQVRA